jgi:hypothetical protein
MEIRVDPAVLWPLLLFFAVVLVLVAGRLGLSYVPGELHREKATGDCSDPHLTSGRKWSIINTC